MEEANRTKRSNNLPARKSHRRISSKIERKNREKNPSFLIFLGKSE